MNTISHTPRFSTIIIALFLGLFCCLPSQAASTKLDQFAFNSHSMKPTTPSSSITILSREEMAQTEGEWAWARALFNQARNFRVRIHYDRKPHRFSNAWGPLAGNRPHYQITIYRKGVKNSNWEIRIPWGGKNHLG